MEIKAELVPGLPADKMIPPEAQRSMAIRAGPHVVEVNASHAVYISQSRAVADYIERPASASLTTAP